MYILILLDLLFFLGLLGSSLAIGQVTIETVAGGKILSGVPAQNVVLGQIDGIARDSVGNTYLCDSQLHVIRRIRPDGIIETIAGTGLSTYSGDGGAAAAATLYHPSWCSLGPSGNLIFADIGNYTIRQIDARGIITALAGTGTRSASGESGPAL